MFARRQEELALLAAAEKKLRLAEEVLWLRNFFIFNVGLFRVPLKHVAGKKEKYRERDREANRKEQIADILEQD